CSALPDARRLVLAGRGEPASIGTACRGKDVAAVPLQSAQLQLAKPLQKVPFEAAMIGFVIERCEPTQDLLRFVDLAVLPLLHCPAKLSDVAAAITLVLALQRHRFIRLGQAFAARGANAVVRREGGACQERQANSRDEQCDPRIAATPAPGPLD